MRKILNILCLSIMIYYSNNIPYKQGTLTKNLRNLQSECDSPKFEFNGICYENCEEMDNNNCSRFPISDTLKICKLVSGSCEITDRTCVEMNENNCRDLVLTNNKVCAKKIIEYPNLNAIF